MLDLQILAQGQPVALFDLPAIMGRAGAARELGDTIEGLIAFMDELGGDPDLEDGGDDELSGDESGDLAWPEWHGRGRHKTDGRAEARNFHSEDDEDSDPDTSVEDGPFDREEDHGAEELGELDEAEYDCRPIADPVAIKFHRDRIRRDRCDRRVFSGRDYHYVEYRLRRDG